MFGHLVIKEWKERWTLAAFAIIVLAGFGIAAQVTADEREAPDILLGAMALVFLPAFGALLGATGFEAEFRNGAWTYLFSRPVKKTNVWSAKFVALLAILVLVWALSLVVISTSAGLRASMSTLTAPGLSGVTRPLISMLVVGFGLSLLIFAMAFAMSLLTERTITVTAVALFLGFLVYGGWLYGFAAASELLLSRFQPSLIWIGLILTGLVALVASFETLRKADLSQSRRKAVFFWRRAGLLLIPVLVVITLAAIWPPGRGRWLWLDCADAGHAYFDTHRGHFVYSADKDQVQRVRLPVMGRYIHLASARGGKVVGFEAGRRWESLFIAGTDGSDKVALTGPKAKDPRLKELPTSGGPLLSPDGRAVVFSTYPRSKRSSKDARPELWLVSDQGEVLKHTAFVQPELISGDYSDSYIYPTGWPEGTNLVLLNLWSSRTEREKPNYIMVWDIDKNELRSLVKDAMLGLASRSTPQKTVAVRRRSADQTGWTLSALNVETASLTDIWTETGLISKFASAYYATAWTPDARRLAFSVDVDDRPRGILGIYSWPDQKLIGRRDLDVKDIRSTELIWTPDGRELAVKNSERKGIEFLDENLEPTRFVAFPEGEDFYRTMIVGDKLLIQEWRKQRLFRLDLKTEQWKRVY